MKSVGTKALRSKESSPKTVERPRTAKRLVKTQISTHPPLQFLTQLWIGGPRICLFDKFPGDTDTASPGITFANDRLTG